MREAGDQPQSIDRACRYAGAAQMIRSGAIVPHVRFTRHNDFVTANRDVLMRFEVPESPAISGWPASNMILQPAIEHALRRKIMSAPSADLRTGWRLTGLSQDGSAVTATIETPREARTIRARYAVGCDGATSTVRRLNQISLSDYGFEEPWLVVDAVLSDDTRLPDRNLQVCDPKRPTTFVLMGGGRHRWEFMLKPGETADSMLDDAVIAELLAPWGMKDTATIERKAVYRFHALVADRWREGRVILAGDAAHQMPPFAGQGLCSGLRDASNLAWKLAAVLRHGAPDALLDTYQSEREPHVRAIIDLALMMGRTVCVTDPAAAAARDQAMLAARASGAAALPELSFPPLADGCLLANSPAAGEIFPQPVAGSGLRMDDVLGPGAWMISRRDLAPEDGLNVASLDSDRLSPFRASLTRWFDKYVADTVLVRPDRHVFGTGETSDLVGFYRQMTRSQRPAR